MSCSLHATGSLPRAGVHVFLSYCGCYDTPETACAEAWVEEGGDEPRVLLSRHVPIGPFDNEADIRRFVDNFLMEAMRTIDLWRSGS